VAHRYHRRHHHVVKPSCPSGESLQCVESPTATPTSTPVD
jgi:hypothetical protein